MVEHGALRSAAGQPEDAPEVTPSILENQPSSVIIIDLAGKITYWNKGAEEMRGWKREEVIGKPLMDLTPPESREFAEGMWEELSQSGHWTGEVEVARKGGGRFPVLVTAEAIKNFSGSVVGYSIASFDITERKQMEKRLRESEEKFRGIAERSFDGIFTLDANATVSYASPTFMRIFGFDSTEVVGKSLADQVPDSEPEPERIKLLQAFADITSGKTVEGLQFEARRKDGSPIFVEVNASPILDEGRVVGVQGVVRDITERKQMEKRLRESEEKFRGIAERSFDGIFKVDANGNLTYTSPSMYKILGFKPEDVIGQSAMKNLSALAIPKVAQALGKVLRGGTIEALEVEARRKDGSPVFIEINASPIYDEGHSVVEIQGVVRDVTERRRAEESRRLFASVVESSPFGMISLRLDGTIISWNPAAERIFGYSPKELIGRQVSVLAPQDRADESTRLLEKLNEEGGVVHLESIRRRKDGRLFDYSLDAFPTTDSSGKMIGLSGFFSDITAQKASEEKIRSLQDARSMFVSAATHELKTPLVSIKGYADLAASGSLGELSEPLKHGLGVVRRNAERMLNLIKELLEIERINSGQLVISKEVVDLKVVIMESVDGLRPIMRSKELEVDIVLPEVELRVIGEEIRLHEVMDNLLVNAVKFTPEKGKLRVVAEDAGQVRVSVTDTGIGISPANLPNLFEPFSKIPKSGFVENQEIYGLYSTGLGLAVTKRLVELQGGRIWAESGGEGKGSTFVFTLPSISQ